MRACAASARLCCECALVRPREGVAWRPIGLCRSFLCSASLPPCLFSLTRCILSIDLLQNLGSTRVCVLPSGEVDPSSVDEHMRADRAIRQRHHTRRRGIHDRTRMSTGSRRSLAHRERRRTEEERKERGGWCCVPGRVGGRVRRECALVRRVPLFLLVEHEKSDSQRNAN